MPDRKGCCLTFDDRCEIEEMLKEGSSFRAIARKLDVSPTTISNEVKRNRTFAKPKNPYGRDRPMCAHYGECSVTGLCRRCDSKAACCKRCRKRNCALICKGFELMQCRLLDSAPYVCSSCQKRGRCTYGRARYVAVKAQAKHEERMRSAHLGISLSEGQLASVVDMVRKQLSQGHSLEAIWAVHGDELPVSVRTFYNYMDKGVMGLANIDLPKKVRYAPRKKRQAGAPKMSFEGRTHADWLDLPERERLLTVQMDTVEGLRRNSKCILTLHFVRLFFQLHILMESKDQAHVKAALDAIETYCEGKFATTFPVILTDRGSEFLDFEKLETGLDGKRRCRVFYCDPVKPGQKGAAEKNHVELRKILPKGTDFDALTFGDVAEASSHVNSYVRAGQGVAPVKLAEAVLPQSLLDNLGVRAIAPDDVVMKPGLLGL